MTRVATTLETLTTLLCEQLRQKPSPNAFGKHWQDGRHRSRLRTARTLWTSIRTLPRRRETRSAAQRLSQGRHANDWNDWGSILREDGKDDRAA